MLSSLFFIEKFTIANINYYRFYFFFTLTITIFEKVTFPKAGHEKTSAVAQHLLWPHPVHGFVLSALAWQLWLAMMMLGFLSM